MITLCTGAPIFTDAGDNTLVSFPSGDGEPIRIVLNRNQLCHLHRAGRAAIDDSFGKPQPDLSQPVPIRSGGRA